MFFQTWPVGPSRRDHTTVAWIRIKLLLSSKDPQTISSNNCSKGILSPFRITTFHEWSLCPDQRLCWSFPYVKHWRRRKLLINKGNTSSILPFLNSVGPPLYPHQRDLLNPSSFPPKKPKIRAGGK
jgi:hypothetical protein